MNNFQNNAKQLLKKIPIPKLDLGISKNYKIAQYVIAFLSLITYIFVIIEFINRIIFTDTALQKQKSVSDRNIMVYGLIVLIISLILTYYLPLPVQISVPILIFSQWYWWKKGI